MDHGFYNLDEAKVKLGCTNNDLLKLGAEGKIELHIWYNGMDYWADVFCPLSLIAEFLPISKDDIMQVYLENNGVPPSQPVTQIALKYKNFPMMLVSGSFFLSTKTLFLSSKTLESVKSSLIKISSELEAISPDEDHKSKKTNLHIIGALLDTIMDKGLYKSETELRQHIAKKFDGFMGCSETTLAKRFKEAKNLLSG